MQITIVQKVAQEMGLTEALVNKVLELSQTGTSTFLSRYKKEEVEGLSSLIIDEIINRFNYLTDLSVDRQKKISAIESLGLLTDEIREKFLSIEVKAELERYYQLLLPVEDSDEEVARQLGLTEVADAVLENAPTEEVIALIPEVEGYEKEQLLDLALALVKEKIAVSREPDELIEKRASSVVAEVEIDTGDTIAKTPEKIKPHQLLAARRNKRKIEMVVPEEVKSEFINKYEGTLAEEAAIQAYTESASNYRKELKKEIMKQAELQAIEVFKKNLREMLLLKGIKNSVIMAVDPGFKNGCKVAIIDENGSPLKWDVLYLFKDKEFKTKLLAYIQEYQPAVIGIGNGTATQESFELVVNILKEENLDTNVCIVNEAGASLYSTSKVAVEEFGDLSPNFISAISLARRIQDPMAELVKVSPENLGVGQYQHDCSITLLREELAKTVFECVNKVGVDLNTASYHLLSYVNGLTKKTAKAIVNYREENGRFNSIEELKQVKGVNAKVFEQASGFLRVYGGIEPLDETGVHPDDYELARTLIS